MKKIIILFSLLIFLILAFSCQEKRNTLIKLDEINLSAGELVQNIDLNSRGASLKLFKNETENNLILQTKWKEEVISIAGCGNCEYVKEDDGTIKVKVLNFRDSQRAFLITAYVRGSTYGAENYFIAYENIQWRLIQLPFERAAFYDVDRDSIDEIIEYKPKSDSSIYSFQKGIIIKKDEGFSNNK